MLTTLGLFSKHSLLNFPPLPEGLAGWAEASAKEIKQTTRIVFMAIGFLLGRSLELKHLGIVIRNELWASFYMCPFGWFWGISIDH